MHTEIVGKFLSTLPEDDDHPYRTGPWRPQNTEWRADNLTVVDGAIPDASYCLVFDAARLPDGPVCKLQLPERISSDTHSTWVAGAVLRRWRTADSAAEAIGL
jgi:carotenoid cleavage dioxygenase-like enzyme